LGPLTRQIIADMRPDEERGDAECVGLRVRCAASARVFMYRYRAQDGAVRQIKLGESGNGAGQLSLAEARAKVVLKKRQRRIEGVDPQHEKREARKLELQKRKAAQGGAYTVAQLIKEYDEEVLSKQKRRRIGVSRGRARGHRRTVPRRPGVLAGVVGQMIFSETHLQAIS